MYTQKFWLASLFSSRGAWLLLTLSALAFEGTALYFQYAMGLNPCIMCIYQRTAMLGILLSGIIGVFACHWPLGRLLGISLWLTSAIWGMLIAVEHVDIQTSTFFVMCEIVPDFPNWAPLHEWFPKFFAATGDCGQIDWQFLTLSMPQWMIIIFALYGLVGIISTLIRLLFLRKI